MRIGIDARLRSYRAGGISEHVSRLLEGLAAIETPEHIIVLEHSRAARRTEAGEATRTDHASSSPPFETCYLRTPPHHRLEGWALPFELKRLRLDLLHCPDVVLPKLWRGPSVVTVHDVAFLREPGLLTTDSRRYYAGVHAAVSRADRTIVVSEHTRRELESLTNVDPERVRVIPNAIPQRFFATGDEARDAAVVARYGLHHPFALFVSTIEPRKNVDTLLRALRLMLDRGRDLTLALAGADGWHSEGVYSQAESLNLRERALFLGFVPDEDLQSLYRAAEVLAHPALDEGFGLTPLEAMASGTPAVVSDVGGLAESVGDAALRVAPTDPAAWADALSMVLDDADLAEQLRESGRSRAAKFTVERMARSTLGVYREVIEDAPVRPRRDAFTKAKGDRR
jgi:glycosyltransferase involved in cell wall biosynthesis